MGILRDLGKRAIKGLTGRAAPGEPPPRPAPPPRPSPAPPAAMAPSAPPPAPAARFPDECQPADLAALRAALGPGPRARVVNHWATWCDPCVEEIPLLVAVHLQLEDFADFIGISWDLFDDDRPPAEVAEHVANFASVRAVRYRSLLVTDPPERFFAGMNLTFDKIPQTWVIAPDGAVLRRIEGALDEASAAELVRFVEGLGRA